VGGRLLMMVSERAKRILAYIVRHQAEHGAPPSIREIGHRFAIRSTNGVCYHLDLLERAGAIRRRRGRARGIVLRAAYHDTYLGSSRAGRGGVPILGQIAAGGPVVSMENIEGVLDADRLEQQRASFALRVHGDSMRDAGILDGDLVMVKEQPAPRSGEIVVAMIGDETTVKRFRRQGNRVILEPANERYEPIVLTAKSPELRILGKVVGVYREFG
jgi:repressor LexA